MNIKEVKVIKDLKLVNKKPEAEKRVAYGTVFDYLLWRGDITLRQSPVNVIDALIFSILTYIDFPRVLKSTQQPTLGAVWRKLQDLPVPDYCCWIADRKAFAAFFELVAKSERFRDITVFDSADKLDNSIDLQFAATTFLLPGNALFIAFRGTDNTVTGWKEDFNMSFMNATPAQIEAKNYADKIAAAHRGRLLLGGHSKGGNLAVWAGVNLKPRYQKRLLRIYNNDGPGFTPEFLTGDAFLATEPKILSFVPESSIVGVLLSNCDYITIKSNNTSVFQHDPFSWQIIGKRFVYNPERSKSGKQLEQAINAKLQELTAAEKAALVEKIFAVLEEQNVKTTDDLKDNIFKSLLVTLPKLIAGIKKM